jgi:hypothetical protein
MHERTKTLIFATFVTLLSLCALAAGEQAVSLAKPLEPLRPFIGKTWKGQFINSKPEKPSYDVAKWERALNGQAVRVLHSVNNGEYGGETIITWNRKAERLEFYYFTTAGYSTHGTIAFEGAKIITHEEVTGNDTDVTAVKATTEILPNGRMHMKSRYLKKGEWVDGHEIVYDESPGAEVLFK